MNGQGCHFALRVILGVQERATESRGSVAASVPLHDPSCCGVTTYPLAAAPPITSPPVEQLVKQLITARGSGSCQPSAAVLTSLPPSICGQILEVAFFTGVLPCQVRARGPPSLASTSPTKAYQVSLRVRVWEYGIVIYPLAFDNQEH